MTVGRWRKVIEMVFMEKHIVEHVHGITISINHKLRNVEYRSTKRFRIELLWEEFDERLAVLENLKNRSQMCSNISD